MVRSLLAVGLLGVLSACATIPDITQARSPCRSEPGGWCAFVRDVAVESYPYAIAATSAYQGDDDIYPDEALGVALVRRNRLDIAEEDADTGFGYQIFDQYAVDESVDADGNPIPVRGDRVARIVAFRGTDLGFKDVFFGSVTKRQIDIALRYFNAERARPDAAGVPKWIVTGHSLGGALATEVSAMYDDVPAWMFNTSPFLKVDPMVNDSMRTVVNERGEWLSRFREYDFSPAANLVVINCAPGRNGFSKHGIRMLSDCITWIAAYENRDAFKVISDNAVEKPPVECGDTTKAHPGPGFQQTSPCAHIARRRKADRE